MITIAPSRVRLGPFLNFSLMTIIVLCVPPVHAGEELLIKWRDGPKSAEASAGNAAIGSQVVRNFPFLGWQWVRLPDGWSAAEGIAHYQGMDAVLSAEVNRPVPLSIPEVNVVRHDPRLAPAGEEPLTPNDPMFRQQWSLRRIGATNAWATTTGSPEVVVAIMDTGVNYRHQDLKDNMWRNPGETGLDAMSRDKATNGVDDDGNGYADDVYGIDPAGQDADPMEQGTQVPSHGTYCASVIGASGNNGQGVAGLNWRVSLMAIRVLGGDLTYEGWTSTFLECYEYLIMMKNRGVNLRVANMSYSNGSTALPAFRDAHQALGEAGILEVCIAHNQGGDLDGWAQFPAAWRLPSMIVVGGSTESDGFWPSSNYGLQTVDLAAPSTGIRVASGPSATAYDTVTGTSFAAPHVAGAAALLLAARPDLFTDQLKAALFGSVDPSPAFRGKVATGGRLNVARAMEYLSDPNPPAIVVGATPRRLAVSPDDPIRVVFNRPMDRATVEASWELVPPAEGTFRWATDNRSVEFRPDQPLDRFTKYTIRLRHTATDETGGTLDGNYNRVREAEGADDFVWKFEFAPVNDEWAGALQLAGSEGTIAGSNRHASVATFAEVPLFPPEWITFGHTVWYLWSPPGNDEWVTFDLTGPATFDPLLLIYRGDRFEDLMTVARSDNYGTRKTGRVSFGAIAGTNYSLVIASQNDLEASDVAEFRLAWHPTPAPVIATFTPSSGLPGTTVTLRGTNFSGATAVMFGVGVAAVTPVAGDSHDFRVTAVVPPDASSGPISILTPHGNTVTTASFEVLAPEVSLRIEATENAFALSWNETTDRFHLAFSTDLLEWNPVISPRRIENGRTVQPFLLQPGSAYFRLGRN